jgi:hypothetical protein
LAVAVMGWTQGRHCYLVSYEYFEDKTEQGCESPESPVWKRVEDLIERRSFGGMRPTITFVDAGYAYDTVVNFCSQYEAGVYPIIGRPSVGKGAITKEFREMQTQSGTFGYQIQVDFYKDRIASVRSIFTRTGSRRYCGGRGPRVPANNRNFILMRQSMRPKVN